MPNDAPDFLAILAILSAHQVEFIIVGALSAVLQGAPIMTFDLDIVHHRTPENIKNLDQALQQLDAHYRGRSPQLTPKTNHLQSAGHQLLITKHGPLDLLGAIEEGLTYQDLLPHTKTVDLDDLSLHLLTLQKYIDLKERFPRDKDHGRLPIFRQILLDDESN